MFKATLRFDELEAREVPAGAEIVTTGIVTDVNLVAVVTGPPADIVTTGVVTDVDLVVRPRSYRPATVVTGRPANVTQPPTGLQLTEPAGLTKPVIALTGYPLGRYFS